MTDTKTPAVGLDEAAGRAMAAQTHYETQAIWLPLLAVHHWGKRPAGLALPTPCGAPQAKEPLPLRQGRLFASRP